MSAEQARCKTILDANIATNAAIAGSKISFANDAISGDKIHSGTITDFASTGIDDNATSLAMTITSGGNIGIGTTTPTASLDIRGSTSIRGSNTNNPAPPVAALELFTGRDATGGLLAGQTSADVAFQWGGAGGGYRHWIRTRHNNSTSSGNAVDFYLNSSLTAAGSSAPGTGSTHTMTLEGGNVGIGITTPNATLGVLASSGKEVMLGGGNITGSELKLTNSGTAHFSIYNSGNNNLTSNIAGTSLMSITSTGNVGIGTTSPDAKLKVQGGRIVASQYSVTGSTVDFNNGNVQILSSVGGSAITLNNMIDGGAYTLIIADTTSRTYTFPNCTNARYLPKNGATTSGKHSIYTILKTTISSSVNCYITWLSGF